jgi:transposase InsO family protein
VRVFEQRRDQHRLPEVLRTDGGSEFLGGPFTACANDAGMATQCPQPRKPNQNAYVECVNRKKLYF